VYVVRANFNGGLLPGMLVSRLRKVYIPFYNKAHEVQNYDVLVGSNYRWDTYKTGQFWPNNVVEGGNSADHKDTLYVCRVNYSKTDYIGKVRFQLFSLGFLFHDVDI
jgi:hypothetical protein